jgi:hypothetical protein
MIRVLIVDDNAVFRQGMRRLIDSISDLEVSAVAGDGASGIDAALARRLAGRIGGSAPQDPFPDRTDREREILDLLAAGASTAQIADRFGLSPKTVRTTCPARSPRSKRSTAPEPCARRVPPAFRAHEGAEAHTASLRRLSASSTSALAGPPAAVRFCAISR